MTFHESYGELPSTTLFLIRRHNVTPAEYDMFVFVKGWSFEEIEQHILNNLRNGVYMAPFPL